MLHVHTIKYLKSNNNNSNSIPAVKNNILLFLCVSKCKSIYFYDWF